MRQHAKFNVLSRRDAYRKSRWTRDFFTTEMYGHSDRRAASFTDSTICIQRRNDSLNSAIHTRYRSSQRSSSMHKPKSLYITETCRAMKLGEVRETYYPQSNMHKLCHKIMICMLYNRLYVGDLCDNVGLVLQVVLCYCSTLAIMTKLFL